jgi:hypothetical protein
MAHSILSRRVGAYVLALSLALATVPSHGPAGSTFGTIQVNGPVWVSSERTGWSKLSATRPLLSGDRLRTGMDGHLLAELGAEGVVGLFSDGELSTRNVAGKPVIEVTRGKLAFHLPAESGLRLEADGASIIATTDVGTGYIEYGEDGVPVVVVERGNLVVQLAGDDREVARGQRLVLRAGAEITPLGIATVDGADRSSPGKAGALSTTVAGSESTASAKTSTVGAAAGGTYLGLGTTGWTAIGAAAVAVAGGTAGGVAAGGGGGGGGGDIPGS